MQAMELGSNGEVAQALTSLPSTKREGARKKGVDGWLTEHLVKLGPCFDWRSRSHSQQASTRAGFHFHHRLFLQQLLPLPVGQIVVVTSLASRRSRCL